ncbi:MAG: prepilin-type N-terminal cleavage/methylation domain-containing protein [Planctomycetota bacterium]|nr:prepilin-type N-terminal cleavage/methylation domain-containing protein [Planctomycetota bacterium]
MNKEQGMTLIEILVSLGIFVMLGSGLVVFLKDGISTWQVGESRREAIERSEAILQPLCADLRSLFSQPDPGPGGGLVDVLLLCDRDALGRSRLRMVSVLDEEVRNPITRIAGSLTGGLADIDYRNDAMEARLGILRAPGGLCEVSYSMGPAAGSEVLWKGFKSPIGGEGTLFNQANLAPDVDGTPMRSRPIADGVLYIEWSFWGGDRRRWVDGKIQPPITRWDSTRGILPMDRKTGIRWDPDSRDDPSDDVFPDTVEVLLVLRPARSMALARLISDIDDRTAEIRVDSTAQYPVGPDHYIRIDSEWIRVGRITRGAFLDCERGMRGSVAQQHARLRPVVHGSEFRKTVRIPGSRDPGGQR